MSLTPNTSSKLSPEAQAVVDAFYYEGPHTQRSIAAVIRSAIGQIAKAEGITISEVDPYDILSIAFEIEENYDYKRV